MQTKELSWVTENDLKRAIDELIAKGCTNIQIVRTTEFESERQDFPYRKIYTACYLIVYKMN